MGALNFLPWKLSATVVRSPVFTFQRETRRPPTSDPSHDSKNPSLSKIKPLALPLSGRERGGFLGGRIEAHDRATVFPHGNIGEVNAPVRRNGGPFGEPPLMGMLRV